MVPKRQGMGGLSQSGTASPPTPFWVSPRASSKKGPQLATFSLIFTKQWFCFTSTKATAGAGRGICPEAPHRLGKIRGQKEPKHES